MQENNNLNSTPISTPEPTVVSTGENKHKLDKKKIIIIAVAIVVLAALVIFYFINKNKAPAEKIYTDEEKIEMIDDVARQMEEQGLPPVEKQIDIMNYNAQN